MKKAAVIGHPAAHSKSPLIHNYWIAAHGLDAHYTAIDIAPADLTAGIARLKTEGYVGFNVTVPHKQAVMALCDTLDDTARTIGAVNTVNIDEAGRLHGRNSDAFGFKANIDQTLPGFDYAAGPAMVLGAGGAARAVIYALLQAGTPHLYVTNRTHDKAEEITSMAPDKISVLDWDARNHHLSDCHLLVNTTSLGMTGKPSLDIDITDLPVSAAVCDIVYAPLMTDLLKTASTRGHPIVTGIGMLLHQARPAFNGWFGIMPAVTDDLESRVMT